MEEQKQNLSVSEINPSGEIDEKAEKFKEIASRRANHACEKILLLGNLANRSTYHYTQEQVDKIFEALDDVVTKTKAKFVVDEPRVKSYVEL
jgi:hypothetical protein